MVTLVLWLRLVTFIIPNDAPSVLLKLQWLNLCLVDEMPMKGLPHKWDGVARHLAYGVNYGFWCHLRLQDRTFFIFWLHIKQKHHHTVLAIITDQV